MAERRSLTAGVNTISDVDPDTVRQFITQERPPLPERRPLPPIDSAELSLVPERLAEPRATKSVVTPEPPTRRRRTKAGIAPVGLIPVTVRLRPELAGALKRASLERQLAGEDYFTQQDLVEQVLEPWLRTQGFLA
ncbi:MAG: hypothetical protein ACKV2Q_20425 [Planctomycetaceae bacterium]